MLSKGCSQKGYIWLSLLNLKRKLKSTAEEKPNINAAEKAERTDCAYCYTLDKPKSEIIVKIQRENTTRRKPLKGKYFRPGLNGDNSRIKRTGMPPKDLDQVEIWRTSTLRKPFRTTSNQKILLSMFHYTPAISQLR